MSINVEVRLAIEKINNLMTHLKAGPKKDAGDCTKTTMNLAQR